MSISRTPSSDPTSGSTSRGTARSSRTSGVGRSPESAARTVSASITVAVAPVAETTRSASAIAAGSLVEALVVVAGPFRQGARVLRASGSAPGSCRRLDRAGALTASPAIWPAPTTTTSRPRRSPRTSAARSAPSATNASGAAPSEVSARARRPARAAAWNSERIAGPDAPSDSAVRSASRTCAWICVSPITIESSPAATANRWSAASCSQCE